MKSRLDIHFTLRQQLLFWSGDRYLPGEREFLINHARSGILLALRALKLPPGSSVGVMTYNCHTVFNAIRQAGLNPVFIDVTEDLKIDIQDLINKRERISALIITHLFGIENNIESIQDAFPGLPIIEDCAHSYGRKKLYGDFTVFSLGQGKLPSIGDGGILFVNNVYYLDRIKSIYNSIPDYSFGQTFALFAALVVRSILYKPFVYSCITEPIKRRRKISNGVEAITPKRMCKGVSSVYLSEKKRIDQYIIGKRAKADEISEELKTNKDINMLLPLGVNAFMLVVRCDNPVHIKKLFRTKGIEVDTHFAHCIDWATCFGYKKGSCPRAELLTRQLIMIPTHY